ncbi:MAG: type VI secretion system baseplate subunit TssG [Geminicoccaceae bacterium]|nr:type VI secretion system baseplate subunit TssG [Geminicoccaceae bacterium]
MAGPDRQPSPALTPAPPGSGEAAAFLAALAAEPWRFDLFQALRVIEAAHPDRPPLGRGRRAADEPVRLGQPPELAFPPAEILAFEPPSRGRPGRLESPVLGLFGPKGPLPLHLTARARARQEGDRTLADFADVFHHRMLALYFRAWAEARPAVEEDRGAASRVRARLRALLGLFGREEERAVVPERFLLFVAGLLLWATRPPEALERALELWLAVPARIEEFRFQRLELPKRLRARLGAARLGRDALLGARVPDRANRFRIRLGPMGLEDYEALLPGGGLLASVVALVELFAGRTFDVELLLVLRREAVPAARLGSGTRLGWTSWLSTARRSRDAEDLVLDGFGRGAGRGGRPWR